MAAEETRKREEFGLIDRGLAYKGDHAPGRGGRDWAPGLVVAWRQGDEAARSRLIDAVYPELRRLARGYLRRRAFEMERDAIIRAAQGVTFEGVLRRLENATTLNRFKIWAEGPTDCTDRGSRPQSTWR
jgi:hypothetical protein